MDKGEKISLSLKEHFKKNGHHKKGKSGHKPSDEIKKKISDSLKQILTEEEKLAKSIRKKALNKAKVYAYRARLRNAIPENADLNLIREIYIHCPTGYHVDHIVALASGGLHHQDNLQYLEISENCRKGKNEIFDSSKSIDWRTIISI